MDGDTIWLLIGLATGSLAALWAWPRMDAKQLAVTHDRSPREEPCWTETVSTDGRLSYGRSGCYNAGLADMEARARTGEFDTPV
jgi:hypothetical protein